MKPLKKCRNCIYNGILWPIQITIVAMETKKKCILFVVLTYIYLYIYIYIYIYHCKQFNEYGRL